MPLQLSIGWSKKVGLPNYGSLGASCNVEVELDQTYLFENPARLQQKARLAFAACRQAVDEELEAQRQASGAQSVQGASPAEQPREASAVPASPRQIEYARRLAADMEELRSGQLEMLVEQRFGKPLAELSRQEASALITLLQDLRRGAQQLEEVLPGVAA
jgi:hypothetical protein